MSTHRSAFKFCTFIFYIFCKNVFCGPSGLQFSTSFKIFCNMILSKLLLQLPLSTAENIYKIKSLGEKISFYNYVVVLSCSSLNFVTRYIICSTFESIMKVHVFFVIKFSLAIEIREEQH